MRNALAVAAATAPVSIASAAAAVPAALAIKPGGYDRGFLAYTVGFGGSMIWFGSSAGVALSNMYPEAKSVGRWLRHGWYIAIAYVIGFFVMLAVIGWNPDAAHRKRVDFPAPHTTLGGVS